ncbi:MAG: ribose-5-phosphate isomerase A [Hyphococcus sp.]|nr:MAG: ribose-5-phosphate isomerase A [Marinicaulis sp.]
MDKEAGKRRAAEEAAKHVKQGMTLGIGTGSTAAHFIAILGERVKEGWQLSGIPTSKETERLAASVGVNMIIPDETTVIDLAVDGTDEADPKLNLIKGGGGALLREKIVAHAAKQFIVIADNSKRVAALGAFPLPIEIEPFGWAITVKNIRTTLRDAGFDTADLNIRTKEGAPFTSDGGYLILDCALGRIGEPADLDKMLGSIPGVVETGLFCGLADMVIYADEDSVSVDKG